ncbi:MAG: 2-oxoisovalerate dehydrogenase E1 component [Sphingobacteriales bacterium]|jgi:2-oxoisovalerate dehydrogenase E1 component
MKETKAKNAELATDISFEQFKEEVLRDYRIACESREASLVGRKEVLTGKAKFGIFGDGKEVPQLAMAKVFENGDFRAGYYRDQTFMFSAGISDIKAFFAQLYANPNLDAEPVSAGRMMNGHYGTRLLDENGKWNSQTDRKNSSADISPTAGQMPRLVGLAQASKMYRENEELHDMTDFSNKGNEIAFGTIGNASSAEGLFFEAINAVGVLKVPLLMSVWDDEYGISVHQKYQITKESISEILSGFQREKDGPGFEIFKVNGWDYPALCETYKKAADICRTEHVPVLVHVVQVTQPQGHSTSGSHERYKSKERLAWEQEFDCIKKMREWMLENGIANAEELEVIEKESQKKARELKREAWNEFITPIKAEQSEMLELLTNLAGASPKADKINALIASLSASTEPIRKEIITNAKAALRACAGESSSELDALKAYLANKESENAELYNSYLFSESDEKFDNIAIVDPIYDEDAKKVDGREVLQACFRAAFTRDKRVVAFGEDVGKIGDVNQAFAGLQEEFGEKRIFDTGIREATIIGQGIGLALRGLRPIAEIQYLDYLMYGLQPLYDDLSNLQYRTKGGQKAPLIVRTRGHRLEGIWHSGSPIGMILNAIRGIHLLVPRDMNRAAAFYNTLLLSDEPAIVIECLNGYRLKEKLPTNIGEVTLPLGVPDVMQEGTDVTLITYGSCCRIALEGMKQLEEFGISVELIDVQSILPFDVNHTIVESLKKTNRVVFMDEDVPGGASAFMMQKVLEDQKGYFYLDSEPKTLCAKEHRPAYGTDGDYFSKPGAEHVFETIYGMMHEVNPDKFPVIY